MAVSLEARVPLLDHVLMEYVATMPAGLKFQDGIGKVILKRAMAADLQSGARWASVCPLPPGSDAR